MSRTETADRHGRDAASPLAIPLPGWWSILQRTYAHIGKDHVSLTAAGVAFYGLLAVFPAIAAMVSMWGLVSDPQEIEREIASVSAVLPEDAGAIIIDQARSIAAGAGAGVTFATIFGLLLAIYSTSKGVKSLMEGLNIIYGEDEKRGFITFNLAALALTFGAIVVAVVALGAVVVVPALVAAIGLDDIVGPSVTLLRWPILAAVALLGLAVLYRFGPSRRRARWQWVSWGAVTATVLWVAASVLFSLYVSQFGTYNETYGTLGGVIILLMWFWLSAFVILLGAELNAEIEHQTARDSTRGAPQPMGERGAQVADTVARQP